jgi:hypothetical protein
MNSRDNSKTSPKDRNPTNQTNQPTKTYTRRSYIQSSIHTALVRSQPPDQTRWPPRTFVGILPYTRTRIVQEQHPAFGVASTLLASPTRNGFLIHTRSAAASSPDATDAPLASYTATRENRKFFPPRDWPETAARGSGFGLDLRVNSGTNLPVFLCSAFYITCARTYMIS